MNFLFPDCIIICYNHNHIIKLVNFLGGGGGDSHTQVLNLRFYLAWIETLFNCFRESIVSIDIVVNINIVKITLQNKTSQLVSFP
jgi:hypothetical protein